MPDVSVVVITRDRRAEVLATIERLRALPERPEVVVVDNRSRDGTPDAIRTAAPDVRVLRAGANLGAAGRNLGAAAARAPLVAFNDDDSCWEAGSLDRAVDRFGRFPRLALLAARVLVGRDARVDPVSAAMAASPLPTEPDLPGVPVLGFLACGAVVHRRRFLEVGGFSPRFGVGGEEALLALDLACRGWGVVYDDELTVRHLPSPHRDGSARAAREVRNSLWTAWLRLPAPIAMRVTSGVLSSALRSRTARRGVADAARGIPWVVRDRRAVPGSLASRWRLVTNSTG